ncbi:MAG TPA: MarR family transcriptional regulator [Novosphingobium sp.]|nr:MarR family transcriptional regulator [Novosphingobium sp.]HZV08259.1 MarR family transcriptional regulator [Novosphingobium sp.]
MKLTDEALITDLGRVYLLMHRRMNRALSAQGLSLARIKTLLCIRRQQGTARAADLADFLDQTPRTVTEMLDGLERDGLITRLPDPDDRRVKRLVLTAQGEQLVTTTEPLRGRIIHEIFTHFAPEERQGLRRALDRFLGELAE